MNASIANLDAMAGFSAPIGSANWRVIGECTFNYDPRSLSLDLSPTKMVMTSIPMTESESLTYLFKCQELAPTWTFHRALCPTPPDEPQASVLSLEHRKHVEWHNALTVSPNESSSPTRRG